ncbi:hypothetical protein G6L28_02505 [Agrobacterium larrymoorei]|uniref:hypothetical protein n=1 Tax=Agrobacterium larrymoorei TaxID=160699 RepID=UPI001571DB8C|nr:hypothetical protein [Agrobacterium larrymoorei]NTJ41469.1 hypothetical protein [Agrobacterium larrymoorei]
MPPSNVEKKTFTPRETRQGVRGRPVLIILVISLFLAFAVWLIAEIWGETTAPPTAETQPAPGPATSQTVNPGAQGGQSFDNNPPAGATAPTEGTDRNPNTQAP